MWDSFFWLPPFCYDTFSINLTFTCEIVIRECFPEFIGTTCWVLYWGSCVPIIRILIMQLVFILIFELFDVLTSDTLMRRSKSVSAFLEKAIFSFIKGFHKGFIKGFHKGLPQWLSRKKFAYSAEDASDSSLIPGLGRSHGGGYGNPLQYSCLEKPMDKGAWRASVHRFTKSWIRLEWLSRYTVWHYHLLAMRTWDTV